MLHFFRIYPILDLLEGYRRAIVMVKIHVPLLLSIVYMLKQCSCTEAPEQKSTCDSLCQEVGNMGFAGLCCGDECL